MSTNWPIYLESGNEGAGPEKSSDLFHLLSGVPSTINSANYVMFICLERVLDLGHPDAVKVFCEQMLELHRGQGTEWLIDLN